MFKNQKGNIAIILGMILALLIVGGGAYYLGTLNQSLLQNPQQISNSPTGIVDNYTPTPTITSQDNSWKETSSSLYGFQLSLPSNWNLQEVNKRPEPTREFDPKIGHDCADYTITSNDNLIKLSLKPTCGFADGGADSWPYDAVIIKDLNNEKYIIRYFDSTKSAYIYADASNSQNGKLQGGILSIRDEQNFVIISTELRYTGEESQKNQYLQIADKVISSLKKI